MKVLAEIIAISNEHRSTSQDGTQMSRVVVTFQIGAELLHATFFKRTENLEKYPFSSDGLVKGTIGDLDYTLSSEIRYSQRDNSPYVQYSVRARWTPKVSAAVAVNVHAEQPEASAQEVAAGMAEAAAVAEAKLGENGLPF